MKNALLIALAIGALFATSCKKQNELTPDTNANTQLTEKQVQPIPILVPEVLFVDKDYVWSITDIASAHPVISRKGNILNTPLSGIMKSNAFNNEGSKFKNPIYDPIHDLMLNSNYDNILSKCAYTDLSTTATTFANSKRIRPIIINPTTGQLYYYSVADMQGPNNTLYPDLQIRRANLNGTNDLSVYKFNFGFDAFPSKGCDIDFNTQTVYFSYGYGIYATNMQTSVEKEMWTNFTGELITDMEVKFDYVNKRIYFATKVPSLNVNRIWRIDASGNNLKKIIETGYTDSKNNFTFGISPETNTLFYCKREFNANTQKHSSTIRRVNLDGGNPLFICTKEYINSIIVASPK